MRRCLDKGAWGSTSVGPAYALPAASRSSPMGHPCYVLFTFHSKPILFNRALRLVDISFFFLRCTATHEPSL